MTTLTLTIVICLAALLLLVPMVVRPSLTKDRLGRVFAFVAILILPVTVGFAGLNEHIENSKTMTFCMSCHVMQQYGQSLHIDDLDHVPAKHWQYGRVPRETACFSCHTDYTLYGDYKAKLRGLKHVYVQYFGKVPDKPHLYTPYNNRECLHCHEGARSFIDAVTHRSEPGQMEAILANKKSCLNKGCHDTVHTVDKVPTLPMWPAEKEKGEKEKGK